MAEISLQEYCQQIEETIEQGRYEEAVAHGKQILKQYPKHVATYRLLGTAMLESGRADDAADMFQRVLSADPEDMVAWIAMSEVHKQRGELDAAVYHLEQAFELAADNQLVEEELRQIYRQRDGAEPQRIQLTRGALARLYLKGNLLSRAINEFRVLLTQHPDRADLAVALAEALWRNEQRLEATEVCQQLLDRLPYCLKANLILGEIWSSSGREEGQGYLRRAEALDPENRMAQALFGAASPLQGRDVYVTPLELAPPIPEEAPAWMGEAGESLPAEVKPAPVDITSALGAQIEIPSWLADIASEEAVAEAPPITTPSIPVAAEPSMEQAPEEITPTPAEEIPQWWEGAGADLTEEQPEIGTLEGIEVPDWLNGLGLEPTEFDLEMEEMPEQPVEPDIGPTGIAEAPITLDEEEVPDWLATLGIEETGEEAPSSAPSEELPADWLSGIRDQFAGEIEAPPEAREPPIEESAPMVEEEPAPEWVAAEELPLADEEPPWLQEPMSPEDLQAQAEAEARLAEIMGQPLGAPQAPSMQAEEATIPPMEEEVPASAELPEWMADTAAPMEKTTPIEEELLAPAWLEEDAELPSGDDALAWLEQLAAGKEEELQAQAQAEAEARMAEIMGRSAPPAEEAPVAEGAPEVPPEEAMAPPLPPVEEEIEPALAEIPDWMREFEPLEGTPAIEGVSASTWREEEEEEELPFDDEELAWLQQPAGKEDEQGRMEAETRLAEIMGMTAPPEPLAVEAEEAGPLPPAVEEAISAGAEIPDWMQDIAPPDVMPPEPTPSALEAEAEEPSAPPAEGAFGWIAFGEPEVPPEPAAAVEEIPPTPEVPVAAEEAVPSAPAAEVEEPLTPSWLEEGAELPSGDDALAWLEQLAAGKEEELQAQAQAEAKARMAEIMGRPTPAAEEVVPTEAIPEEAPAPEGVAAPPGLPTEERAPAEPVAPAAPEAEEVPVPAWLEEEPIVPAGEVPAAEAALEEVPSVTDVVSEEVAAPPVEEGIPVEKIAPPSEEIAPPEPVYVEEAVAPPVAEIPIKEPVPPPEAVPAVEEVEEAVPEETVTPLTAVEPVPAAAETAEPEPVEPPMAEPAAPPPAPVVE